VGGCPCRAIAENGGPLTTVQCAGLLGEDVGKIRSLEAMVYLKLRRSRARVEALLGEWPATRAFGWDAIDEKVTALNDLDAQAMNRQIAKRWRELGWK
jgi:hypothetical protein